MTTLHERDEFTEWIDPQSDIRSYILSKRVAPHQQSFYFVNQSFSADGHFLWFYTFFPPSGNVQGNGRTLGVLHTESGSMYHFPETQFSDGSPMIDSLTGDAYWVTGLEIWKRSPGPSDVPVRVATFPAELANNRALRRVATHLTMSSDRAWLNVDAQIGQEWFVGAAPLSGGPVEIWQTFDRCYNHGQFSPTDPDLQMIAQDWWHDSNTGARHQYQDRLWLIRKGERARPIYPHDPSARRTHEWWQANGSHVWYVDYDRGTEKVNIATGERTNVWPDGTCHSFCDSTGTYIAGDIGTYSWSQTGCKVVFFNVESGREVAIASDLPEPEGGRGRYHVDPHPRFCLNDEYVCYTTTVDGRADLALTPVAELIKATS